MFKLRLYLSNRLALLASQIQASKSSCKSQFCHTQSKVPYRCTVSIIYQSRVNANVTVNGNANVDVGCVVSVLMRLGVYLLINNVNVTNYASFMRGVN